MFYALWLYPSKVRQLWGGPKQTEVSHQFVIDHPTWKKACDGDFCSRWCRYAYERGCLMCEPCLASKVLLSHNIVIILNIVTCSMFTSSSKSIIIISMVSDMSDIVSDISHIVFELCLIYVVTGADKVQQVSEHYRPWRSSSSPSSSSPSSSSGSSSSSSLSSWDGSWQIGPRTDSWAPGPNCPLFLGGLLGPRSII